MQVERSDSGEVSISARSTMQEPLACPATFDGRDASVLDESAPDLRESAETEDDVYSEASAEPDDGLFEGTVRLRVEPKGDIFQVVKFLRELRRQSQVRVLRLEGSLRDDVEMLLRLAEPVRLEELISQIEDVSEVSAPVRTGLTSENEERVVNVRLEERTGLSLTPSPSHAGAGA